MLSSDIDRIASGVLSEIQLETSHNNWTPSPVQNGGTPVFTCSDGAATFNWIIDLPNHAIVQITSSVTTTVTITDPLNGEAITIGVWAPATFAAVGEHAETDSVPMVDVENNPDADANNPSVDPSQSGS